jgi:hypothetical protein
VAGTAARASSPVISAPQGVGCNNLGWSGLQTEQ